MSQIEKAMDEYFVKKAPFQIPASGKKALVAWSPWISLIIGIFALFAALGLWRVGHAVNELANYTNQLSQTYGLGTTTAELGIMFYVALFALVAQGLLMVAAFPGLRARSKSSGWNLVLYGTLANFGYGIFVTFTDQGSMSNLVGSVIGLVVGLYLLAQIRSYYTAAKSA